MKPRLLPTRRTSLCALAIVTASLAASTLARAQSHGDGTSQTHSAYTGPSDQEIVQRSQDRKQQIEATNQRIRDEREARYQREREADQARQQRLYAEEQARQQQARDAWSARQKQIEADRKKAGLPIWHSENAPR